MTFAPIETDRLIIRAPEIGDVEPLHERRNHPDTARYQSWSIPFPLEDARRIVAGAAAMGGPADDEWWMVTAVERSTGAVVGDLAIHQSWQGRAAELGYSLHPDHWGRGLATEAVGAVADALIERGVRRLSATTHPDNTASFRVLERVGFEYEGRTVGSWFEGDGPEAETTDDLLFGMTAEGRHRWLTRPSDRPARVELVEIDNDNHRAVAKLETHYSQRNMVAPVWASFGNALFPERPDGKRIDPWYRAIAAGDEPDELVGFVMLALPTEPDQEPYLWRLLIDRWHQRRGIASLALDRIEADLRAEGHEAVTVSWVGGAGSPEPFYLGRGYVSMGPGGDGEIVGRKPLV